MVAERWSVWPNWALNQELGDGHGVVLLGGPGYVDVDVDSAHRLPLHRAEDIELRCHALADVGGASACARPPVSEVDQTVLSSVAAHLARAHGLVCFDPQLGLLRPTAEESAA